MNLRSLISGNPDGCGRTGATRAGARPAVRIAAAALIGLCTAFGPAAANAQSYLNNRIRVAPPQPSFGVRQFAEMRPAAGPVVYVTDAAGELSTISLGTYAVRRIGAEGEVLTDIAFAPNGQLYGVSFTSFYRVSPTTGQTTFIGNLGISDANALVFNAKGEAFTVGSNEAELYSIDVRSGDARAIGSTSPFSSAGDLTFYNGTLVLSGYTSNINGPDTLVALNPSNGRAMGSVQLNVANLFGLVSTGKNLLFGFAGTDMYQLFPDQSNIYKRAVKLKDFARSGMAQIYGAAYDGAFQN